ncbi:MAG: FtsX-like permease family protein [Sulfurimonas sp.]|nr:FtsX-like permease family protein [Sulfurimonas sp.]MDD5203239.1 FtsX-like permease family protein [Sulfurimonas sp.]
MFNLTQNIYLKMAVLHIFRRRGRAILISLMIALSLIGLLLMEGLYEGMMVQMTQNTVKTGSGTISIQHKSFRAQNNINYNIDNSQSITEILDSYSQIKSYALRINQQALVATAGYSQSITVMGIDLLKEKNHSQLQDFIIDGDYSFGKRERGVLIGYRLAKKLKLSIGKKVIVTMQDTNNEIVSIALKIEGILKTHNTLIDSSTLVMNQTIMAKLIGIQGVTEVAILLKSQNDEYLFKQNLISTLKNDTLAIYTYKELSPSLHEGEVMMQTFNSISSAFIFIVATLGIFGVVLVSVLERIREFGIMMAIGTQFKDIARLIIYESLIITLSGYFIGAILGAALLWYLKIYGLDLSGFSDAFAIFGMDSSMHAIIKPEYFTQSLASVILATLAAVIIPIRTLKKRNPIQSINE